MPDAILSPEIDETPAKGEVPRLHALRLAAAKARAAAARWDGGDAYILSADTVVGCGRRILPKAETPGQGAECLSLLSGRRTAVITMKSKDDLAPLYDRADPASAVAARLQAGVVAQVKHCAAGWCHVNGNGFDGWIEQQRLWGVYADEKVD